MDPKRTKHILEACLLVAARPMSVVQLEALFEGDEERPTRDRIREAIAALREDYAERAIELVEVASGYRLQSRVEVQHWVSRLFQERTPRYSRALLETLVLVAYRQPITRGEIEEVRGVAVSSNIVRTLQERQWVREVGYKDVPGKPALLGTTRQFLDYFNLKRLEDLPTLGELKDLDAFDAVLAETGFVEGAVDGPAANDADEGEGGASAGSSPPHGDGGAGADPDPDPDPDVEADGSADVVADVVGDADGTDEAVADRDGADGGGARDGEPGDGATGDPRGIDGDGARDPLPVDVARAAPGTDRDDRSTRSDAARERASDVDPETAADSAGVDTTTVDLVLDEVAPGDGSMAGPEAPGLAPEATGDDGSRAREAEADVAVERRDALGGRGASDREGASTDGAGAPVHVPSFGAMDLPLADDAAPFDPERYRAGPEAAGPVAGVADAPPEGASSPEPEPPLVVDADDFSFAEASVVASASPTPSAPGRPRSDTADTADAVEAEREGPGRDDVGDESVGRGDGRPYEDPQAALRRVIDRFAAEHRRDLEGVPVPNGASARAPRAPVDESANGPADASVPAEPPDRDDRVP